MFQPNRHILKQVYLDLLIETTSSQFVFLCRTAHQKRLQVVLDLLH